MKNQERHRQSAFQKWIPVIGLIFILGFFGSLMWSNKSYSNNAITAQLFEVSTNSQNDVKIINEIPETNKKYIEHQYLIAEHFYRTNDFVRAIDTYDLILKNQRNNAYDLSNINFDAVKWNRILMVLGKGDRTKTLENIEDFIKSDISKNYKTKALMLKEKLNSFWYGWAN